MSELYRLVYYSRNRMQGSPDAVAQSIHQILAASRQNNALVGVTGALMFNAGCFGQVLEGPRAALENVFERIQQDDRHGEVSLLSFEGAEARSFETWSMGFVGQSVEDAARFASVGQDSGYDPSRLTGDALFEALQRLALEEERSVA